MGYIIQVGGFNPSEKYARQIGHLPQIGLKIIKYLKPTLLINGIY